MQDLTLRWMNCLHSSASSSSFGNEIVRKAAARALSMNARLLGGTKGNGKSTLAFLHIWVQSTYVLFLLLLNDNEGLWFFLI